MSEPAWLTAARRYIGFHEQPGNRGIEEFIRLAHTGQVGDAWCAIFANACLESAGFPGTRSAAARSFENNPHFTKLTTPKVGAIVTFWRGSPSSGQGHVGFYVGAGPQVLGGNQGDEVCIEPQNADRVTGYWWPKEQTIDVGVPPPSRQVGITATVFGGVGDDEKSAYDGHLITDTELGVSLPYRFRGSRPKVRVIRGSKSIVCPIVDLGPWNIADPYWQTGARPQAETGTDNTGRKTNRAGIDLSPAAARVLGIDGKGLVDWEFAVDDTTTAQPSPTPNPQPLPIPGGMGGRFDATSFFTYITAHPQEAHAVLSFAVGLFNAANPQLQITLPGLGGATPPAPAPAPPPPPAPPPTLQRPSVQLSVLGGIVTTILQAVGVIGAPVGEGATMAGTLSTLIPIATTIFGGVGGFASIAKTLVKIIAVIPK